MKKVITIALAFFVLIFSDCKNRGDGDIRSSEGKGGITLGGVLRINEVENINSLIPIAINEVNSFHVASQVYEGLVKYNQKDLSIMPALATHWEIISNNTEYLFYLRRDVLFHNDSCFSDAKGRKVYS